MEKALPLAFLATAAAVASVAAYYVVSQPKKSQKLKLYYFNIPGRGESIRLLCTYAGLDFEDIRLSNEEFDSLKQKRFFAFGQVPALEVDGKEILVQSLAILRYVGKLAGLYPSDPILAAKVDAVLDEEADLTAGLSVSRYYARFGFGFFQEHKDLLMGVRKELNDTILPKHLASLEKIAQSSATGWIAGTVEPSPADFLLAVRLPWLASGVNDGISTEILQPYPALRAVIDKVLSLPAIKKYYQK